MRCVKGKGKIVDFSLPFHTPHGQRNLSALLPIHLTRLIQKCPLFLSVEGGHWLLFIGQCVKVFPPLLQTFVDLWITLSKLGYQRLLLLDHLLSFRTGRVSTLSSKTPDLCLDSSPLLVGPALIFFGPFAPLCYLLSCCR